MGLLCWTTLVQHQDSSVTTAFSLLHNRPASYSQNGRAKDHERTTRRHGWYSPASRKQSHLGRRPRPPSSNKVSLLDVEEDGGGKSRSPPTLSPSLESLTVKELRQLVKDSHQLERGVLSRLKLKKDLIDFLEGATTVDSGAGDENDGNHDHSATTTDQVSTNASPSATATVTTKVESQTKTARTTTMPMRMPSSSSLTVNGAELSPPSSNGSTRTDEELLMSPKERMFEKVYERYPHVRDMVTVTASSDTNGTDTIIQAAPTFLGGLGEEDMRQQCHPIFQDCSTSSDMDIVFVGTASCTPGVTRGVSCTALRLNWKRRSVLGVLPPEDQHGGLDTTPSITQPPPPGGTASSFLGGTWIFDCGECTQVRLFVRLAP